jgi:RNA polymerase sigma-70 factor (ECF subfamily)
LVVSESSGQNQALRDPDVRLMLEVQEDCAASFEELVRRYQGRVLRVLEHHVGDRDQAEDLFQEVFLRVYRARKSYTPDAKFNTWLFTIVKNVASNALRSRSRRREVSLRVQDTGSTAMATMDRVAAAPSGQMPARQIEKAETQEVVRLAVASLSERQRMAVLLSKFEGLSYADIAAVMELTPQAIKSLLSRARVNLRDVLEPYVQRGGRPGPEAGEGTREEGRERRDER